jgi:hypothetical protein
LGQGPHPNDLARLRINGFITRVPGRNLYLLTGDGLGIAIFYTKLHDRLLRSLLAADRPPAPPPIRKALHAIDIHIADRPAYCQKQPGSSRQLSKF